MPYRNPYNFGLGIQNPQAQPNSIFGFQLTDPTQQMLQDRQIQQLTDYQLRNPMQLRLGEFGTQQTNLQQAMGGRTSPVHPDPPPTPGVQQPSSFLPWVNTGIQGLVGLGNLGLGWMALRQGQEQFEFQKDLANRNLENSIQSYNTAIRNRASGRGYATQEQRQAAYERDRLRR